MDPSQRKYPYKKPAGHVPPLEPQPVLAAYLREMIAAKRWRNL